MSCTDKSIYSKVLMVGDYAGADAVGGMAAVVQNYMKLVPHLKYIYTWKPSSSRIYKLLVLLAAYARMIAKLIADRDIEIVHIHTCSGASFWRCAGFVNLAAMFGKKVVLHMHGGRFKEFCAESGKSDKIMEVISKADRFVVLSQMWADWFVSMGVKRESVRVLNNMVIPYEGMKVSEYDGMLNLLFLGNVTKDKGIYDLLEVIAANKEAWIDKVALKIGGEDKEGQLLPFIKDNGLESSVQYCGYVTGQDKRELLEWCNIFVLPSYYEGLPMSILEAMSCGKAVIASNVGGIPTVVRSGENGVLIKPGDRAALASAVDSYVSDPDRLTSEGARSVEIVSDYLPEKVMADLAEIYTF